MDHTSSPFISLDEVVIDTVTRLMWTRVTSIHCCALARDCATKILNHEHFGYRGWRMPTNSEFDGLVKNIGGDTLQHFRSVGFYIYKNKKKGNIRILARRDPEIYKR